MNHHDTNPAPPQPTAQADAGPGAGEHMSERTASA